MRKNSVKGNPATSVGVLVRVLSVLFFFAVLGVQPAAATTVYGDFSGDNFDYLGVQETSSWGDPEPLFGAPSIVGDSLVFSPTTFSATAAGAGDQDQTGAHLQATIMSTGLDPIDIITITEFGEIDLSGVGTPGTGGWIGMSGWVTVLETGSATPCTAAIPIAGMFTPSDLYGLPGDLGTTAFSGNVTVDVGAICSNVTKAALSFNNDMAVASEDGTTVLMEKNHIAISVGHAPEPSAAILFAVGFTAVGLRVRRGRANAA